MSDTLRDKLAKLAMDNPKMRKDLLPIIKEAADDELSDEKEVDPKPFEKNLSDAISKLIGFKVSLKVKQHPTKGHLLVASDDLSDKTGMKLFQTLTIENFGGNGRAPNPKTNIAYWVPISYRFTLLSGGSNGMSIANFFLDDNGEILKQNNWQ